MPSHQRIPTLMSNHRKRRRSCRCSKGIVRAHSIGVQAIPQEIDTELERLCAGHLKLQYYREYKMKRKRGKYPNLTISAKCGDQDDGPIEPHYGHNYVPNPKELNYENTTLSEP